METEIKLVDLRKENLGTVNQAIKIASTLGATNFNFFVNPSFIKNGLVTTKIVPIITTAPPASQEVLDFTALKNLKKTVDFAKKVLVEDGEVTVTEKDEPVVHATTLAAEAGVVAEAAVADAVSSEDDEIKVKAKRKKDKNTETASPELPASEESE